MDDEIRNLQLDRPDKRGKSTEQLKKHSLDPHLEGRPIDKALFLLAKGDEIQKLSVVQSFPALVNEDADAALLKVLPKIQQELHSSSSEFQISTSQIFQVIINRNYVTECNVTSTLLQGLDEKDPMVVNAWLETLLGGIFSLPYHDIQTEVLPFAVHKGQSVQPVVSRINCCKILGKICVHPNIKPLDIKKDILPTVYELCQDINYCVRGAVCEQMPWIARGLGNVLVKNLLLPNLVELSSDDNINVRAKAISSVANIMPYIDKEAKTNTMVPLVMQLSQKILNTDDIAFLTFAKEIGVFVSHLQNNLSYNEAEQLYAVYILICKKCTTENPVFSLRNFDASQDIQCRQYCASNLPAMASFATNILPKKVDEVCNIFKMFASDNCYMVRQSVASIFYDFTKILGPYNSLVKDEFVKLMKDEAEEVLQLLIPQFNLIMAVYCTNGILSFEISNNTTKEMKKALTKCHAQLKKGFNWRLLACYLKQLEYLPMSFPCPVYYPDFMPIVMNCAVYGRARPVRIQASRTLLVFLRYNTNPIQRTWLRDHIIIELGESLCCYTRHIFIQACIHALQIFSNKYFKENFFLALIKLANDKVSTVRYSVVSLFPMLRSLIRLPQDRKLLQAFDNTILDLEKNEKDRDVLANLGVQSKEMGVLKLNQGDVNALEKHLIEEEENVLKGKLSFNKTIKPKAVAGSKTPGTSAPSTGKPISQQPRKPTALKSVPSKASNKEIISEMSFLKQHFYTDAGVHLPMDQLSDKTTNSRTETQDKPVECDLSTANITDDIKVNLRNMSRKPVDKSKRYSHSEIPTAVSSNVAKSKRHSTVGFETNVKATTDRRRSLNINQRESSKIPVILKSVENLSLRGESAEQSDDAAKRSKATHNKKTVSGLPLPVRRKT